MNSVLLYHGDPTVGAHLERALGRRGYRVTSVQDAEQGLARLKTDAPHIVLINLNIESNRGLDLLEAIHEWKLLSIPIGLLDRRIAGLIAEAQKLGCRYFLQTGTGFLESLDKLLGRIRERFVTEEALRPSVVLEVLVNLEEKAVSVSINGLGSALEFGRTALKGRTMQRIGEFLRKSQPVSDRICNGWNPDDYQIPSEMGRELREEVLTHMFLDLYRWSKQLLQAADDNLWLIFGGDIELVSMPLELAHLESNLDGRPDYLGLRHPLVRRVASYRHPYPRLAARYPWSGELLNVLLIGANTEGTVKLPDGVVRELEPIPGVDKEIADLADYFQRFKGGLIGELEVLSRHDATEAKLRQCLRKDQRWHIVHFAGHGVNHPTRPDHSALFLGSDGDQKKPTAVYAYQLRELLSSNSMPPQLIYLNACEVMQVIPNPARHASCQGILGALLQAGIPHVLGFRWPAEDEQAIKFARVFYTELFDQQLSVETALLKARREMWQGDQLTSPIWASAVLVSQVAPQGML